MNLFYREHQASEALRPYVYCYWTLTSDGQPHETSAEQRCFPSGCIEWIIQARSVLKGCNNGEWFDYQRAIFTGINDQAKAWVAYGAAETLGVRLTPEGALHLFNLPLKEYHNQVLDAEDFAGKKIRSIVDQVVDANDMPVRLALLEHFLLQQIKYKTLENNYFIEALRQIRHQDKLNITELSRQVYVCERQLQRSFQNILGISPKAYQKVMRLYKAHHLGLLRADSFSKIAHRLGYADPGHLTRDFKNYFGMAPELHFNSTRMNWMN